MAYDQQQDRFYKNFTGANGGSYKLIFQPAHNADPVGGFINDVEFPDGIIQKDLIVKSGYDSDIPVGLPLAQTMSIKLDLSGFSGDFVDVGNWILQKSYGTQRGVNSRNITIPNRWILLKESVSGGGFDTIKFDGIQDFKPKSKLPIKDDDTIYSFECLGMFRAVFERVISDDLAFLTETFTNGTVGAAQNSISYDEYITGPNHLFFLDYTSSIQSVGMISLSQFMSQSETLLNNVYEALTRQTTDVFTSTIGSLFANLTFYRKTTQINNLRGVALSPTSTNVFFPAYVYTNSVKTGGLLTKNNSVNSSPNSWTNQFTSFWDVLKYLVDTSRQKIMFDYNGTVGYTFNFINVFDADTTHKSSVERTLTRADFEFLKDGALNQNEQLISQASASWKTNGQDEITSIELSNNAILNEESADTKLLLHNNRLKAVRATRNGIYTQLHKDAVNSEFTIPDNRLYCLPTAISSGDQFDLVHDTLDINYGDSITKISPTTISRPPLTTSKQIVREQWNTGCDYSTRFSSLGLMITQSIIDLLANPYQYLMELSCNSDKVECNDLGNVFTIDIDEIKPDNIALSYPSETTSCILVNVEENIILEQSKCKFFKRGTNAI